MNKIQLKGFYCMGCKGSEVRVFSPRLRESRLSEILEAFFYRHEYTFVYPFRDQEQ